MKIFGVTGQTGAGKTTVLEFLQTKGGFVIDCDAVYWEILEKNQSLIAEIIERFPSAEYPQGIVDRKKLGVVVFGDVEKLLMLNQITHPYVLEKVENHIQEAKAQGYDLLAIDAIALIESGLHHRCDWTIAVVADESVRIPRIMKRDGISEEYARNRAKSQQKEEFYRDHANIVVENNFSKKEEFFTYIEEFLEKF